MASCIKTILCGGIISTLFNSNYSKTFNNSLDIDLGDNNGD